MTKDERKILLIRLLSSRVTETILSTGKEFCKANPDFSFNDYYECFRTVISDEMCFIDNGFRDASKEMMNELKEKNANIRGNFMTKDKKKDLLVSLVSSKLTPLILGTGNYFHEIHPGLSPEDHYECLKEALHIELAALESGFLAMKNKE